MLSLKSQRQMAAKILKVGEHRVWIDPEKIDDVEIAISRREIRTLIHNKVIQKRPEKGVSRARARIIHSKKKIGRRRGQGSRSGSKNAKISKKDKWMMKIRAQRKKLRELKNNHNITIKDYRKLYDMSESGYFKTVSDIKRFLESHAIRRRR
jgi:large subunit ribosomal protein L19e